MGEIVNLKRVKKQWARADAAALAAQNRALHGRTKAERAAEDAARSRLARAVDGALLPDADPAGDA